MVVVQTRSDQRLARARQRAVLKGMQFIASACVQEDVLLYLGTSLLYSLGSLARTAADADLRTWARTLGRHAFRVWEQACLAHADPDDSDWVGEAVRGYAAGTSLGLRRDSMRPYLRRAARKFDSTTMIGFDAHVGPPPCTQRGAYRTWCVGLTSAWCGEGFGVPLGVRYGAVLRWLPRMRDYHLAWNGEPGTFEEVAYAVTHVVYTLNDYGRWLLDPRWLPTEYLFLRGALPVALELGNADLVGELLDSLRAFGVTDADPPGAAHLPLSDRHAERRRQLGTLHREQLLHRLSRRMGRDRRLARLPMERPTYCLSRTLADAAIVRALRHNMADNTWTTLQRLERRYPARADAQQRPRDERAVCSRCLGGTCCTTEGPIALTPFDVLRLAAALDLSPAHLLMCFTQDRFEGPDGARYDAWLREPENSVITFLRRRTLDAASPCIFLKYKRELDGTPRRVCSVHAARPLACREYYHDTCSTRWTGEMATLEAIGYEALRDGTLDAATVQARWEASAPRSDTDWLADEWQRAFWSEMRRAMEPETANREGSFDARLPELQDPIDQKINRLLSTLRLRFEEKYGQEPLAEQRHGFGDGLSLASGPEHDRLMDIVAQPPGPEPLHGPDGLRLHLGHRALLAPPASVQQELLRLSARCGRDGPVGQNPHLLALHLAMCVAFTRLRVAGSRGLGRAAARHAAWAITLCNERLEYPDDSIAAADGLAQLAHLGVVQASRSLRTWMRTSAAREFEVTLAPWRRLLAREPAALCARSPLALMVWCEPRASLRWLTRRWSHPEMESLPADDLLCWAEHCLRLPDFDANWLAPAHGAMEGLRSTPLSSLWDAPVNRVSELWHDDYVLRAVQHSGLRAVRLSPSFDAERPSPK